MKDFLSDKKNKTPSKIFGMIGLIVSLSWVISNGGFIGNSLPFLRNWFIDIFPFIITLLTIFSIALLSFGFSKSEPKPDDHWKQYQKPKEDE